MSYRVVTEVRFTDQFSKLSADEQQAEQIAAMEIVARNGGNFDNILVVPSEQLALTVTTYPDERSSHKAHLQIMNRGAYDLRARRCYPLDEWMGIAEEATQETVVGV